MKSEHAFFQPLNPGVERMWQVNLRTCYQGLSNRFESHLVILLQQQVPQRHVVTVDDVGGIWLWHFSYDDGHVEQAEVR